MQDTELEASRPLRPVVEVLKELGIRTSCWTAVRWCRAGVRGKRLRALRVGHKWMTRPDWAREFIEDLQESQPCNPAAGKKPKARTSDWAAAKLASEGLGQ